MKKENEWHGWHFLKEDRKLQFPPHTKVKVGQTLKHKDKLPIELCIRGLHASKSPRDALKYAPGPVLCYVRLSGEIIDSEDKSVATERTVIWMADSSELLHRMAIWSAKQSFRLQKKMGKKIDPRSLSAVKAKEGWLAGKITDLELAAAWSAAQSAWSAAQSARSAAQSAAESAAESAARSARSAAESAAWSAAESAAWSAAWSAAESAAWSAAESAARSAAESAAWSAAWSAAESAQNKQMLKMILALMKETRFKGYNP